jgi:hypothetical protein
MKIRKSLAGIAAGSLALAGLAVATAPTANASTVTGQLFRCNVLTSANPWTTNITSTAVANPVGVGASTTVTTSFSAPQFNGPVPIAPNTLRAVINYAVDGGAVTSVVTPVLTENAGTTIPAGGSFNVPVTTASLTFPTTGVKNFEIVSVVFDNWDGSAGDAFANYPNGATPAGVDTNCLAVASVSGTPGNYTWGAYTGNVNTEDITVVGPEISVSAVTNTGADDVIGGGDDTVMPGAVNGGRAYFRGLDALSISGNAQWDPAYTAAGNMQVRVCADAAGTVSCSPYAAYPTPPGLSVNGSGQLSSGDVQVATGSFTGNQYLIISQHSVTGNPAFGGPNPANRSDSNLVKKASFPITILGAQTVAGPPAVSPGATNAISGSNWYPGSTVTVRSRITGPANSTDASVGFTATATGALPASATYVVNDANSIEFSATDAVGGAAVSPFSINAFQCTAQTGNTTGGAGCFTRQQVNATVISGNLSQAAIPTGSNIDNLQVNFGSLTTPLVATPRNGDLNTIEVTDNRGGTYGWSLTAQMPDLAGSGYSIDNALLAIDPGCTAIVAGSAAGCSNEASQNFGGAVTLAQKNLTVDTTSQTTSGKYSIAAPLVLTIPAFQAAANYSATMTITLI